MSTPPATRLAPPRPRPTRFEDYPKIRQLMREVERGDDAGIPRPEAGHPAADGPAHDWARLWLDNPLWPRLGKDWPIGWVLEDPAGRVVGSLGNIPSLYRFRGRELVCANGRAWVVSRAYRGFALWLMEEYFNQPGADLFINTTVGPRAVEVFSTLSARVPLGDWEALGYWVTGYRAFARAALRKLGVPLAGALALPAAAALRLKDALCARALPAAPAGVVVSAADGFDARFDAFWEELVRQNPDRLLAARDSGALAWHYAVPMRQGRLWTFTATRSGLLRAWCVLDRHDGGQGLRRMRLVDYQTVEPDADLLPALVRAALRRCAAEGCCALEHLGCGLPKMRSLDLLAPYRRRLPCWPYYYRAADPALQAELRRPEVWDPSSFDGDASFD